MSHIMQDNPARMSADERVAEIASIMAAAIIRIKNRKLRKNKGNSLDSSPERSVYQTQQGGEEP